MLRFSKDAPSSRLARPLSFTAEEWLRLHALRHAIQDGTRTEYPFSVEEVARLLFYRWLVRRPAFTR
jgi:hypothetical protein